MNDRTYISWIMLCFLAAFVPLECFLRPPLHSAQNAAMLLVQVAWLAPMLPVWRWNAGLRWNLKYFLCGLFTASGIFVSFMLAPEAYDEYASPLSRADIAGVVFMGLSLGFIAGLFALKAGSIPRALGIGVLSLVVQIAALFSLMAAFFPSIVV